MMESPPRSVSSDGVIEAEDESDVPESDVPEIELIIKVSIQHSINFIFLIILQDIVS